ncbi:MAG TPA: hypothetical protein VM098_06235, partial [Phycisphaerae bacterium]|nr:hypothetical protein [Phycisphaerae bacterium]
MDQTVKHALDAIITKEAWTAEDYDQLLRLLFDLPDAANKLREILAKLLADNPQPSGTAALKIG